MKVKIYNLKLAHQYLKKNGFSLISTMLIMMLMVALAFAMLSFSKISSRSSTTEVAQAEARANARMALMIAIGELQMYSGPDTRITAPADTVVSGAPPLTGVWKSWEGTNHDSVGRPITPDYTVKTNSESSGGRFLTWLVSGARTGQGPLFPAPATLVSTVATANTIPLLSSGTLGAEPGQVHVTPQFVNEETGAIGWWVSPENQKARLIHPYSPRSDNAAGWADFARTHSVPDPEVFGLEAHLDDLENYNPDPNNAKITSKAITLDTTEFLAYANPETPHQGFHDLSTSAMGLMTNSATGGWRKDMSILTEKWEDIYAAYPGGMLPLFRYSPAAGNTSAVPKPEEATYDVAQSNLYPWSGYYLIGANKTPSTYHAASASWQSLVNFATHYKTINYNSTASTIEAPFGWSTKILSFSGTGGKDEEYYDYYHGFDVGPIMARIQMLLQVNAVPDPDPSRSDPENYHLLNLRLVPIITLWNPYNVSISKKIVDGSYNPAQDEDYAISSLRSLPITLGIMNGTEPPTGGFKYKLFNRGSKNTIDDGGTGSDTSGEYDYQLSENIRKGYAARSAGNSNGESPYYLPSSNPTPNKGSLGAWLPIEMNLKPGEVKVYGPGNLTSDNFRSGVRLKEGYTNDDIAGLFIHDPDTIADSYEDLVVVEGRTGGQLLATDQLRFSLKTDRYTKIYSNNMTTAVGGGTSFSIMTSLFPVAIANYESGGTPDEVTFMHKNMVVATDMTWAEKYWPNSEVEEVQLQVSDIVAGGGNPEWTNIYSVSFGPRLTIGTYGGSSGGVISRATKGMLQGSPFVSNSYSLPHQEAIYHPANSAYEMAYSAIPNNNNLVPEVGTAGYIVTGLQSGDGLSRMIMAEIPLRPMSSIVELQNWNLRGGNPLPPFQYYLIGNSDATPLIKQDSVLPETLQTKIGNTTVSVSENLQHDDAYCANHLLFDDWFFSSITPKTTAFGNSISKNIEAVYKDFLQGNDLLPNRSYRAISKDQKLSSADADLRVTEILSSPTGDGFLKIASRFEVEGMFNVNSTSVKAWRALLGHARKSQVAYYAANGIGLDTNVHENVVSRYTIASDTEAGEDPGLSAAFTSGSEYSGFRTLTSDQLDELAIKIVEQVRERGPFLSLSEFVNRQLNLGDPDLALSGALQAALDSLSDAHDPNAALKDSVKELSSETMLMDPGNADDPLGGVGYVFEQASEGYSTHGFPGWIRQADILRPIAPVLSARDDTFTIRAYGDYRDVNGDVVATAWCEATVQRRRYYVDPADAADSIDAPTNAQNIKFGRRYDIVAFRWLPEDEV